MSNLHLLLLTEEQHSMLRRLMEQAYETAQACPESLGEAATEDEAETLLDTASSLVDVLDGKEQSFLLPETHEGALAAWLGELDCNACDDDSEA